VLEGIDGIPVSVETLSPQKEPSRPVRMVVVSDVEND
jgi:hypothetical protein